jgi:YidC/Oxa1 family membrane protein insertase
MIFLYNLIGDVGVAILVVTIIVRLVLVPLSVKSIKSQKALQDLQPKINEIKNKFKDKKEEQSKALMEFYKENKINPLSSCLPMLIQLPIIFALYRVFRMGLTEESMQHLYSFVQKPEVLDPLFLGIVNMSEPNVILAVLAGVFQFLQSKMMMPKKKKKPTGKGIMGDVSSIMSKQMTYFMPVMTVFIAMSLPSGLALYWAATTLFAIGQQYIIMKSPKSEEKK